MKKRWNGMTEAYTQDNFTDTPPPPPPPPESYDDLY